LARLLAGHTDAVRACAFSPDGQRLLSAGDDQTLRLWNAQSGEQILACQGHQGPIRSCAFSPDGQRLLSAGVDHSLRLWDAQSGEQILACQGHQGRVWSCAFSPDGQRLLSAGVDQTLRLWDAQFGEQILVCQGHMDWVLSCAFSPDGQRLLSAGSDGSLRIWDARTVSPLWAIQVLPDGAYAVTQGAGNRVIRANEPAWRWVGWNVRGPDGRITRLPADTYGPLEQVLNGTPPSARSQC